MSAGRRPDPWQERGARDLPMAAVARRAVRKRLEAVRKLLPEPGTEPAAEHVHELRVATRRAAAAVAVAGPHLSPRLAGRLKAMLRTARRAAADLRRADVLAGLLEGVVADAAFGAALGGLRAPALEQYATLAEPAFAARFRKLARAARRALAGPTALRSRRDPRARDYTLGDAAARALPPLIAAVSEPPLEDAAGDPHWHALRLAVKKLRYALELLGAAAPPRVRTEALGRLAEAQEVLGAWNDAEEAAAALGALARIAPAAEQLAAQRDAARRTALDACRAWRQGAAGAALRAALAELAARDDDESAPAPAPDAALRHHRVAAIDVGTNSIRLVVAETDPLGGFRVVEDLKETTRLGGGMFATGKLAPEAMDASVAALARLRQAAVAARAEHIRAIGTAAVREAANRAEFLARAEDEAGVAIEVVDAEREARLAFASVAGSMNLSRRRVAVVDIGGGSAEIVFSSGGLVDDWRSLKLGAVRLTDAVAHLAHDPEAQHLAMRTIAGETILAGVADRPDYRIDAIIGTGGTFNNLARLAARDGAATADGARFLFAVSGCELPRAEVARLLAWLRRLTPEERRTVAGLNARRAEIIVAGVTVVDVLMERLGVERLQVHDGGVRYGLLAEMIDDLGLEPAPPRRQAADALAGAADYAARACPDRPHAEHVARLALQLFDQLARDHADAFGAWNTPDARLLLEVGALLHDVGQTVSYRRHHRHGYDMLRRAELPALDRRERELVALLARYHRKRGPRADDPELRPLSAGDQRLLCHLAGILRIADGLDRAHDQCVLRAGLRSARGRLVVEARASERPVAGLRSARAKSGVFRAAFRTPLDFRWTPSAQPAGATVP